MKKPFFVLLALVAILAGCPSSPVDVGVEASASEFAPASSVDAAVDAAPAPHRLGSFNPTCTGTGLPHVVSGVQTGACALVSATADVTGVLALANGGTNSASGLTTANGVVTSSGTALQQASGVSAGTNFVSIGATPALTGAVRLANNQGIQERNAGNTADLNIASVSTGSVLTIWGGTAGTYGAIRIGVPSNDSLYFVTDTTYLINLTSVSLGVGIPIIGAIINNSPYGVHGKVTDATVGTFTLSAASYAMDAILLSGGTAGTVTFPSVGSDAVAYYKTVINTSGVTKTLSDGGATTAGLVTGTTGRYLLDTAGVHLVSPTTAYP